MLDAPGQSPRRTDDLDYTLLPVTPFGARTTPASVTLPPPAGGHRAARRRPLASQRPDRGWRRGDPRPGAQRCRHAGHRPGRRPAAGRRRLPHRADGQRPQLRLRRDAHPGLPRGSRIAGRRRAGAASDWASVPFRSVVSPRASWISPSSWAQISQPAGGDGDRRTIRGAAQLSTVDTTESRALALTAAAAAADKKATDIRILDLGELLGITDFFVLVSAEQRAPARHGRRRGPAQDRRAGPQAAPARGHHATPAGCCWTTATSSSTPSPSEQREYYALERLWSDAPVVPFDDRRRPRRPASPSTDAAVRLSRSTRVVLVRHGESRVERRRPHPGPGRHGPVSARRAPGEGDARTCWAALSRRSHARVAATSSASLQTAQPWRGRSVERMSRRRALARDRCRDLVGLDLGRGRRAGPGDARGVARRQDVRRGGGETFAELRARTAAGAARTCAAWRHRDRVHPRRLVCVCRRRRARPAPMGELMALGPAGNCSITEIELRPGSVDIARRVQHAALAAVVHHQRR